MMDDWNETEEQQFFSFSSSQRKDDTDYWPDLAAPAMRDLLQRRYEEFKRIEREEGGDSDEAFEAGAALTAVIMRVLFG